MAVQVTLATTLAPATLDMLHPTVTDFTQAGIVIAGNVGKFLDVMPRVGETFDVDATDLAQPGTSSPDSA